MPPAKSLGTSRPVIFGVALLFGLIMGVAVAFLRDWLDTTVHNEQDVSAITGVAVIGIIPNLRNEVLSSKYRSIVRGEFPALPATTGEASARRRKPDDGGRSVSCTAHEPELRHPARPPRIIVVTSALSGDGKTTSARTSR